MLALIHERCAEIEPSVTRLGFEQGLVILPPARAEEMHAVDPSGIEELCETRSSVGRVPWPIVQTIIAGPVGAGLPSGKEARRQGLMLVLYEGARTVGCGRVEADLC